jgi:hypothetical protein
MLGALSLSKRLRVILSLSKDEPVERARWLLRRASDGIVIPE